MGDAFWQSQAPKDQSVHCKARLLQITRGKLIYRTWSLCCRWQEGKCTFGDRCNYAHGEADLRPLPPEGYEILERLENRRTRQDVSRCADVSHFCHPQDILMGLRYVLPLQQCHVAGGLALLLHAMHARVIILHADTGINGVVRCHFPGWHCSMQCCGCLTGGRLLQDEVGPPRPFEPRKSLPEVCPSAHIKCCSVKALVADLHT